MEHQDGDGIQDAGGAGLDGVTVQLLDAGGNQIATQVTSGRGLLPVHGAPRRTSRCRFTTALGLHAEQRPDQGPEQRPKDSDASVGHGRDRAYTRLASGGGPHRATQFLPQRRQSATRRSSTPTTATGIQDASEAGLDGVTVRLLERRGDTAIAAQVTSGERGLLPVRGAGARIVSVPVRDALRLHTDGSRPRPQQRPKDSDASVTGAEARPVHPGRRPDGPPPVDAGTPSSSNQRPAFRRRQRQQDPGRRRGGPGRGDGAAAGHQGQRDRRAGDLSRALYLFAGLKQDILGAFSRRPSATRRRRPTRDRRRQGLRRYGGLTQPGPYSPWPAARRT